MWHNYNTQPQSCVRFNYRYCDFGLFFKCQKNRLGNQGHEDRLLSRLSRLQLTT